MKAVLAAHRFGQCNIENMTDVILMMAVERARNLIGGWNFHLFLDGNTLAGLTHASLSDDYLHRQSCPGARDSTSERDTRKEKRKKHVRQHQRVTSGATKRDFLARRVYRYGGPRPECKTSLCVCYLTPYSRHNNVRVRAHPAPVPQTRRAMGGSGFHDGPELHLLPSVTPVPVRLEEAQGERLFVFLLPPF